MYILETHGKTVIVLGWVYAQSQQYEMSEPLKSLVWPGSRMFGKKFQTGSDRINLN